MLTSLLLAAAIHPALASSHREAPAIAKDPSADLTDLYAFLDPNDSSKLVILANVIPMEDPGGAPNFHAFDPNVKYQINIDNEGDGSADIAYTFTFTNSAYNFGTSFLYNLGDISNSANLNQTQSYTVTRIQDGRNTTLASGLQVAPINVGEASSMAGNYNPYSSTPGTVTTSHTYTGSGRYGGYQFFAGPRADHFWVDLPRTFDLLTAYTHSDNQNTLLGKNVHTLAIEVPVSALTKDGMSPSAARQNRVISVWATTYRKATTVIGTDGAVTTSGTWKQVARLGNPLVNEAVIGIQDKDKFNATPVSATGDYVFLDYVLNPTLIDYMTALLGVPTPTDADCNAGLGIGGREDLVLAFLTGHPSLGTLPDGFALGGPIPGEAGKYFAAFEALRINLQAGAGFGMWPNGRGLHDDVVDVAVSAEAGYLCASGGSGYIDDGVTEDGLATLDVFPFIGDPWSGDNHPNELDR